MGRKKVVYVCVHVQVHAVPGGQKYITSGDLEGHKELHSEYKETAQSISVYMNTLMFECFSWGSHVGNYQTLSISTLFPLVAKHIRTSPSPRSLHTQRYSYSQKAQKQTGCKKNCKTKTCKKCGNKIDR